METKTKTTKLIEQCLNEMYKTSKPSITWAGVKKKYGGKKVEFFLKHKIREKDYERIREKYEKMLGSRKRGLAWVLLDYSPTIEEERKCQMK